MQENRSFSCMKGIFCVNFKYGSAFWGIQSGAKEAFSFFCERQSSVALRMHMGGVFMGQN